MDENKGTSSGAFRRLVLAAVHSLKESAREEKREKERILRQQEDEERAWARVESARLRCPVGSALSRLVQCLDSELGRWDSHPIVLWKCALRLAEEAQRETPGEEALHTALHRLTVTLERPRRHRGSKRHRARMLRKKLEACRGELSGFLRRPDKAPGQEREGEVQTTEITPKKRRSPVDWQKLDAHAAMLMVQDPTVTDKKVASILGVRRQALYEGRMPCFMKAKQQRKQAADERRSELPRGSIDEDGLEAWRPED